MGRAGQSGPAVAGEQAGGDPRSAQQEGEAANGQCAVSTHLAPVGALVLIQSGVAGTSAILAASKVP